MSATSGAEGVQKIAAFLLSLDEERANAIMRHMPEDLLAEVARAMSAIDARFGEPEALATLYRELSARLTKKGLRIRRPRGFEEMIRQALGAQRAEGLLADIAERRRRERPFEPIESYEPALLAEVLKSESPAVVALVLAHIDPARSAPVLEKLGPERSLDVLKRMAALRPPGLDTLLEIARALEQELRARAALDAGTSAPKDSLETIADILNMSGEQTGQGLLQGLDAEDADTARKIRERMFSWEDLALIDKRAMQKILASVNTPTLAMALKASPPAVEEKILSNLSERVRDMVSEEREIAGAVPKSRVEQARAEILESVRALMDSGELRPARGGEDLVT